MELVHLEETLIARMRELVPHLSPAAKREAELTNFPMLVQHLQEFRRVRALWQRRAHELNGG